jgi:hypothetical protein
MSTTALAQYDAMRLQVAHCARVDEAAEIRNRADKLRAYAKQKKDHELHRWMGEIFCRATLRYGELSKAETKAQGRRTDRLLPSGGKKSKAEQIKASGLSTSAAQRAEALAGARSDLDDEMGVEALGIALDTAELYFQQCRKQKTTPNQRQLTGIVNQALDDRFGRPKRAARPRKRSDLTNAFIDWTAAVTALATLQADLEALAAHALCSPARDLEHAEKAMLRLQQWLELMEEKHVGIGGGDIGTRVVREGPRQVPPT